MMAHVDKCMELSAQAKYELKSILIPNDDLWIRDYGPIFASETESSLATDSNKIIVEFGFNSYGCKFPPFDKDDHATKHIAEFKGLEIHSYKEVLEGGAIDYSSDNKLITTRECVLNPSRGKNLTETAYLKR